MATRIVPKTQLRDRIRSELADLGEDTLVITERGAPVAVAVAVERWNALQETIEDLEDAVSILEHRISQDAGRPLDEAIRDLDRDVSGPTHQVR